MKSAAALALKRTNFWFLCFWLNEFMNEINKANGIGLFSLLVDLLSRLWAVAGHGAPRREANAKRRTAQQFIMNAVDGFARWIDLLVDEINKANQWMKGNPINKWSAKQPRCAVSRKGKSINSFTQFVIELMIELRKRLVLFSFLLRQQMKWSWWVMGRRPLCRTTTPLQRKLNFSSSLRLVCPFFFLQQRKDERRSWLISLID